MAGPVQGATTRRQMLGRAALLTGTVLLSAAWQAKSRVFTGEVNVDPGCGCCHVWVKILRETGRFNLKVVENTSMQTFKDSAGVPRALRSCHTAMIGGLAFEGHVPAEDVIRLLESLPTGVTGIAVPGMPLGSPGMEIPSGARDAFNVVSFTRDGKTQVFNRYAQRP